MELLVFAVAGSFGCNYSVGARFFPSNYTGCLYNLLPVANVSVC